MASKKHRDPGSKLKYNGTNNCEMFLNHLIDILNLPYSVIYITSLSSLKN